MKATPAYAPANGSKTDPLPSQTQAYLKGVSVAKAGGPRRAAPLCNIGHGSVTVCGHLASLGQVTEVWILVAGGCGWIASIHDWGITGQCSQRTGEPEHVERREVGEVCEAHPPPQRSALINSCKESRARGVIW